MRYTEKTLLKGTHLKSSPLNIIDEEKGYMAHLQKKK